MAQQLDAFPERERSDSKYPWEQWGNGNVWELVKGEDFTTSVASMRQTVAKAARRQGVSVKTRGYKRDGRESLAIQFNRPVQNGAPKRGRRGKATTGA